MNLNNNKDNALEQAISQTLEDYARQEVPADLDLWSNIRQRLQTSPTFDDNTAELYVSEPNSQALNAKKAKNRSWLTLAGLAAVALLAVFLVVASVLLNKSTKETNPSTAFAAQPTVTALPTATPLNTATVARATVVAPTATPVTTVSQNAVPTVPILTPTPKPIKSIQPPFNTPTAYPPLPTATAPSAKGKIVYSVNAPDGSIMTSTIFIMNSDGSDRKKIAEGWSPIFSPDGSRVAFYTLTGQIPTGPVSFPQVVIRSLKLDGSEPQDYCTISSNAAGDLGAWSPRNRYISFRGGQNGPGVIVLCDLNTNQLIMEFKLQNNKVYSVYDWSADGDYAVWGSDANGANWMVDLYYGDPDKGVAGATRLTNGQYRVSDPNGFLGTYYKARISPDGRTIAVIGTEIFFLSVPGQQSPFAGKTLGTLVNVPTVGNLYWTWSPDSQSLLMGDSYNTNLRLVDIASGKVTALLSNLPGTISGLAWSR